MGYYQSSMIVLVNYGTKPGKCGCGQALTAACWLSTALCWNHMHNERFLIVGDILLVWTWIHDPHHPSGGQATNFTESWFWSVAESNVKVKPY